MTNMMCYILFGTDNHTVLGVYTTPDLAVDAREKRQAELGIVSNSSDELCIAWVPMDKNPNPYCDLSSVHG